MESRIVITQPYVFPYINYFHLIKASDKIIFYDDINYITGGWINRNRILLNNKDHLITIPVEKGSQNKKTNEIIPLIDSKYKNKTYHQLKHAYSKAPYFDDVMNLICHTFSQKYVSIGDLAINSIVNVCNYIGLSIDYDRSSLCAPETINLGRSDRLIAIAKKFNFDHYLNVDWGKSIHSKEYYSRCGITLQYISSYDSYYKQFNDIPIPNLSIIDMLMFTEIDRINDFLTQYKIS